MPARADCGACNLCCTLLGVPDIQKPARMACQWTSIHGGCSRHHEKDTAPDLGACKAFKCLWLVSQDREDPLPRYMRPDQCHVVLGPADREDPTLIYVQVDDAFSDSWKKPPISDYLQGILDRGGKVEIILGEDRFPLNLG